MANCKITQYYVCFEGDYPINPIIPVLDKNRSLIAMVSPECFAAFSLEGSGKLNDGRVINVTGGWTSSTTDITAALIKIATNWYKGRSGYAGLSPSGNYYFTYDVCSSAWGVGMHNTPLIPFKSVASDQSVYPYGTELIIASLVGKTMPDGSISDGKVNCIDCGSGILGAHLDLMVGKKGWEIDIPDYSDVELV